MCFHMYFESCEETFKAIEIDLIKNLGIYKSGYFQTNKSVGTKNHTIYRHQGPYSLLTV